MANLMTGIFIDGVGAKREITIACDEDGQLVISGGGGGGGGLTAPQTTAAVKAALETATNIGVGTERTLTLTTLTNSGTIPTGCRGFAVANTGSSSITVAGGTLIAGASIEAPIPNGDFLGAVAYDATGGSILVMEVR